MSMLNFINVIYSIIIPSLIITGAVVFWVWLEVANYLKEKKRKMRGRK